MQLYYVCSPQTTSCKPFVLCFACTYFLKLKSNADIYKLFINNKRNPVGILPLFPLKACSNDAFHKLHTQN